MEEQEPSLPLEILRAIVWNPKLRIPFLNLPLALLTSGLLYTIQRYLLPALLRETLHRQYKNLVTSRFVCDNSGYLFAALYILIALNDPISQFGWWTSAWLMAWSAMQRSANSLISDFLSTAVLLLGFSWNSAAVWGACCLDEAAEGELSKATGWKGLWWTSLGSGKLWEGIRRDGWAGKFRCSLPVVLEVVVCIFVAYTWRERRGWMEIGDAWVVDGGTVGEKKAGFLEAAGGNGDHRSADEEKTALKARYQDASPRV